MPHRSRPPLHSTSRLAPTEDDSGASSCASSVPVEDRKGSASAGGGFDLVEDVFNLIFGGCCRPQYATATAATPDSSKRKDFVSTMNDQAAKEETRRSSRSRRGDSIQEIPQPPEIRRLALAEELQSLQLERSGSLSFLVYQDDVVG